MADPTLAGANGAAAEAAAADRGSDDFARRLIASVEDCAMVMLGVAGNVVTWNAGAQRLTGYEASEIIGRHVSAFYPSPDIADGKPDRDLLAAAERQLESEGWRVRRDGSRFWANVVITALRDPDGSLRGFGHITRDLTARRRDEEERRASEECFRLLVEGVEDYAILMLDPHGHVATWNIGAQRIKGYAAADIIGRHFSVFYPPDDIAAGKPTQLLSEAARDGRLENEGWRVRKDGSRFWASVVITALRDADGSLRGFGKITRDLTARRNAELELRASEERFRLMVARVEDYAIYMLDAGGNVKTWNAGAQRFKGYRAEDIIGRHYSVFYPADDVAAGKPARLLLIAASEGRVEDEGWRVRSDGSQFWANVVITALRDADGTLLGFGKITRDLTERRLHERQLEHLADHDPLTGILNRRGFARELEGHVAHVARYGAAGALLMLDLDNFKHYNDTQGHAAGDGLIVRIARNLQYRLRSSDVLARLGGDEFAILLPAGDEAATAAVADAVLGVIRDEPMPPIISAEQRVTASIGIARFEDGERLTPQEMIANADLAMYDAKASGRNRWVRYRAERHNGPRIESGTRWAVEIGAALAHDGFELVAQPIVPFKLKRRMHFELLLRMRRGAGDAVAPNSFLNHAERFGLIGEIDRWVTVRAIEMLAQQHALGNDVRFSINLSGLTVGDERLLELVERHLAERGVPPNRLVFEVSEAAALTHIGRAARFAAGLAKIGCGFALDNFGACFGSLYHVKHLPFEYLKIDGEFVERCVESATNQTLIAAIVQIAHGMHKRTIAECVSSAKTIEVLMRLGVDYGQGFYLGPPAPLATYLGSTPASHIATTAFAT